MIFDTLLSHHSHPTRCYIDHFRPKKKHSTRYAYAADMENRETRENNPLLGQDQPQLRPEAPEKADGTRSSQYEP